MTESNLKHSDQQHFGGDKELEYPEGTNPGRVHCPSHRTGPKSPQTLGSLGFNYFPPL